MIPTTIAFRSPVLGRANAKDDALKSPHAKAISLVMEIHKAEIAQAEFKHFDERGTDWFRAGSKRIGLHNTITRNWSAWRPFAPGVIDSTHYFIVSYTLGASELGRWSVDTRKRTAQLLAKGAVM